jgi:hypothetical protein
MSTQDTKDGVAFVCDECEAEWTPPRLGRGSAVPNFRECLNMAKEAGWRAIPVPSRSSKTDWQHKCPGCL